MVRRYLLATLVVLMLATAAHSYEGFVKPELVCMVNDRIMGAPQIPVEVEGKTYYGCCAGCVGALKNDESVRYATDPITGNRVDKAKAYILAGPQGIALYFESPESAKKYLEKLKK